MNLDLAPKLKQKEFDDLNVAYNTVQKEYDTFLGDVQQDLQDFNTIKKMTKDPTAFVAKYSAAYTDVISTYKTDYLPVYNKLNVQQGKAIPPILISIAPKLIQAVIDIIQKRDDLKQEHISNVLGVVNAFFFDKLRMKKWYELSLAPASANANTTSTPTSSTDNSGSVRGRGNVETPKPSPSEEVLNEPTPVNPPVFSKMEGFVEFVVLTADGKEEKMNFAKRGGKDIVITSRRVNNGQVQSQNNTVSTDFLTSELAYTEGTQYFIKVNNTAGLYLLTLNANNTVSTLYPCAVDAANPIPGSTSTMKDYSGAKDVIIAKRNTNPVAGQDINGFTIFPTPDFTKSPPDPNYFTLTGANKTPENFCIILSKSVLDVDLFKKQLETTTGNMDERLAKVLKADAMTYSEGQVSPEGNKVTFNAATSKKSVLPLVFYIKR